MSQPRVCVYYHVLPQTGFRDDGCPLFLNYNLRKILNGDGKFEDHSRNVVHLAPIPDKMSKFGRFDLNILVDYGEDALGIDLDFEIPHPSAYWVSDAHLGYEYRLQRARQFDYVFCCQKSFIDKFIEDGISPHKLFYLPHAFEPDIYKPISIIKKFNWCFVGYPNSDKRISLLDAFIKNFRSYYLGWRIPGAQGYNEMEDVNYKYNQADLIVNDSVKNDLNMRTFETLGSGTLLLTEDNPELQGLFENGKHLVTFKSIEEAVELARGLLIDESTRTAIAKIGHDEVMEKHTYRHRAEEILEKCLSYKGEVVLV